MNYFEKRHLRKLVQHVLHESRHARHMREDIVAEELIEKLIGQENDLKSAFEEGHVKRVQECTDTLTKTVHQVYPVHKNPRWRENIEILVVAISVAMAFRTFFIQPFRIPTGSMQPTLYGITYEQDDVKTLMDRFPLKILNYFLFGELHKEITAKASGVITFNQEYTSDSYIFRIAGKPHVVPRGMPMHFEPGITEFQKGDVIASGRKKLGDHIFVNRLLYNFTSPNRGDIFVFSTRDIKHPEIRPDNYYIKRLVGLPGEKISINPPYLYADGVKVTSPEAFVRQVSGEGYHGYYLVGETPTKAYLKHRGDYIQLADNEYLPFGDNTRASLDGRFFGGVDQESIIGPAFMVYWPFGHRWGLVH